VLLIGATRFSRSQPRAEERVESFVGALAAQEAIWRINDLKQIIYFEKRK